MKTTHSLPNITSNWECSLAHSCSCITKGPKRRVLVAGNFNVTADICLSQHKKKKEQEIEKEEK
jgi:hypothetical protein